MAASKHIKKLRWSFAHPIFDISDKQIHQKYLPITEYKKIAKRVIRFLQKAHSVGIQTLGDHSVILCMFDQNELDIVAKLGG